MVFRQISARLRYALFKQDKSYRLGTVKHSLPTSARDIPSCADIVYRITLEGENPLKVWREYRGLTQEQLAEALGDISRAYIS
ncbi:MAG: helix-turn-helix transcriptional regulator [Xenococcaceae cyanobacterium MO_207.B15]|nr:helix-turn-helix transcriptional regulator [Xenococcaceae cyanobacterium MO_207.B15]MDJ0747190.1 helix-turn-helix transcriptional regulator [Xenococcaceae cyanobacterium MO_167.B27]